MRGAEFACTLLPTNPTAKGWMRLRSQVQRGRRVEFSFVSEQLVPNVDNAKFAPSVIAADGASGVPRVSAPAARSASGSAISTLKNRFGLV